MANLVKYFSRYLNILALLPCVLLSGVMFYDIYHSYSRMQNAYGTEYNAFMSHGVLSFVHEVQKERGVTAGYIGSKGSKFSDQLSAQRKVVDDKYKYLLDKRSHWQLSKEMASTFDEFTYTLSNLKNIRKRVDELDIYLVDAIKFYTNINESGLHSVILASKYSDEALISSELSAIYNFSSAKESAGLERAVLANVLAQGQITPALRMKHAELITKQTVSLSQAYEAAPKQIFDIFSQVQTSQANRNVIKVRNEVAERDNNFATDSSTWFSYATDRINELKELEERALTVVDQSALKIQKHAVNVLVVEIIILIAGFLITLALYLTIGNRQKQSLKIAEGISIAINDRNMNHDIEVISFDELGDTAQNINKLTKLFSDDLKSFSATSKNITALTQETSAVIGQSQENLLSQKEQVENIASAAEQMSTSVSEISNSMETNAESVSQVVENAKEGQVTVIKAVEVINQAADDMEESSKAIHALNDQVGNISSMVELIRGIAEQTNLLALNAAIEAARAGEQGRGFAVVADEVRGLASRTQASTDEIGVIVEKLQNDSTHAFEVIERGQKNASVASEQSELIKIVLDKITAQIENVQEVTGSVSINTKEQSSALTSVNNNISAIFKQAVENVSGADKIGNAASNISESVTDIDNQIKRYQT